MKRTVVDCDACGKEALENYHTLEFVVGTQIDPPSGRTEEVVETLEFCTGCLGKVAQEAIKCRSLDEQKAMYARWTDQKRENQNRKPDRPTRYAPAGVVYRAG